MGAVLGFVVFAIVQACPLNASGQTWGKKLLKSKIVDLAGGKPTLRRLPGMRYLPVQAVGVIPLLGALIQTVALLLIFRSDRSCGHELTAGNKVVHAVNGSQACREGGCTHCEISAVGASLK